MPRLAVDVSFTAHPLEMPQPFATRLTSQPERAIAQGISTARHGGVSHATQNWNPTKGINEGWWPTALNLCGTTITVSAAQNNDVRICNGHTAEATTDGEQDTVLAMYPKQPFDISGRTGTVVFDVSDDAQGPHAAYLGVIPAILRLKGTNGG